MSIGMPVRLAEQFRSLEPDHKYNDSVGILDGKTFQDHLSNYWRVRWPDGEKISYQAEFLDVA